MLKQKGNWVDDLQEGIWKYYYPDGKVQAIVHFRNGRQDGKSYFFRQGGEKEQTLNYRFGKLDGVCTTFYLNNSLKSISKWENGNKKDVTFFDSLK